MPDEGLPPGFADFTRWVAARENTVLDGREPPEIILRAARRARDETFIAARAASNGPPNRGGQTIEVIELLAAASTDANSPPPELITAKGFRLNLVYDEGSGADGSSICVLVRCPPELISTLQGGTLYLWSGTTRFELGQFDADGKAIGTLPAGIEITLTDFASGSVKLETPSASSDG